jgi:uncharacterized membrane protein
MSTLIFFLLRATHVLFAAVWIGSSVFTSGLLLPAIEKSGPSGGQVMTSINRRGLHLYMLSLGLTTVATGIYLLWRFTGGFDPAVGATHAGIAFGTGGAAGILAAIVGGAIVGRSAAKIQDIMGRLATVPDGPAKGALVSQATALRQKVKVASSIQIGLQTTALVLMAVGHYI